jgi:L-alanine-DL-glutamate epimerase-like enolase superfamily enzyme
MQISKVEVVPIELDLQKPVQMASLPEIEGITAVFVRMETLQGQSAWGCAVAHPWLTGEEPEDMIRVCQDCAAKVPDLHPLNIEYSLSELQELVVDAPSALCAFDLAYHDLLAFIAGIPLYRLLGGYRNRIQTSATIPIGSVKESVERAQTLAMRGFRILKVKGGMNPEEDVQRIRAIRRILPNFTLRLDPDGGYSVKEALEVAQALDGEIEMLEQPTGKDELNELQEVTKFSPIPILADQCVRQPDSALELAAHHFVDGLSVKLAVCGGIRNAQQIVTIARVAKLTTMISCIIEPALLVAAGLGLALSSPSVQYADLDGHLGLLDDPSIPGFKMEDGWLIAAEVPGIGCGVDLVF